MLKKISGIICGILICYAILFMCAYAGFELPGQRGDGSALRTAVDTVPQYELIVDPYKPYSYEQLLIDSAVLEDMYPDLIRVSEIGRSVEDRQILSIEFGKGARTMIMVGTHHAREYITSTFLMKMIDEYAYAYSTGGSFGDYDVKALLDSVTIHVVVMLNPDGVNLVQSGPESVLNPEKLREIGLSVKTYSEWKANINGVDLNMNYPAEWEAKRSAGQPRSQGFKGSVSGSEPETQALMAYTESNDFLMAVSLHTKGEVVYWSDRRTINAFPNQKEIARTISEVTGYGLLGMSADPRIYAAGFENWFRAEMLRPAFCIEMTPYNGTIPHDDEDFDELVWNKAKYLGLALAGECISDSMVKQYD